MTGFNQFWNAYPRKVGKLAAHRAFQKARLHGATLPALLEGVERYKRGKPSYADWAHPTTWLTQGRWMDEYGPLSSTQPWDCPHTPACDARWQCHQRTEMDAYRSAHVHDAIR